MQINGLQWDEKLSLKINHWIYRQHLEPSINDKSKQKRFVEVWVTFYGHEALKGSMLIIWLFLSHSRTIRKVF